MLLKRRLLENSRWHPKRAAGSAAGVVRPENKEYRCGVGPNSSWQKTDLWKRSCFGPQPGRYAIMLETNRSYDWNKTYTKKNSGVNGQPSIVYRAELDIGSGSRTAAFEPIGTGSVDGSDARIQLGLQGIDTALQLFSSLQVTYRD